MADWWDKPRNVTVCVDTEGWFDPFAGQLVERISAGGDKAVFVRNPSEALDSGVAFYLSCTRLTPSDVLDRNHRNVVVHASALPKGRGFSPVVWQVLESENRIPVTMIEAAEDADAGDIVAEDHIMLDGTELNDEIRGLLGEKIVEMCLEYLASATPPEGRAQAGEPTWYRRRTRDDSRLDPHRTIAEQFDLLRVVDNVRYPAFFDYRGRRYVVRIEAEGE